MVSVGGTARSETLHILDALRLEHKFRVVFFQCSSEVRVHVQKRVGV